MNRRSTPLARASLEEAVYEAIRNEILGGELVPGDPLVEAQLSERFGISKTPVREALIRLKRDGLADGTLHRTTRVATPTSDDIHQVCEIRAWIETQLAANAAAKPSKQLLRRLEASISDAERALESDDDRAYVKAIRSFSDELIRATDNHYAVQFLERLRDRLALIANASRGVAGRRRRSIDEHRAIFEAIRRRDPEAAAAATRVHLSSIEADSLAAVARLEAGET